MVEHGQSTSVAQSASEHVYTTTTTYRYCLVKMPKALHRWASAILLLLITQGG